MTWKRTHCKHGHELTPDNIVIRRAAGATYESCRPCKNERSKREYEAHPEWRHRAKNTDRQNLARHRVRTAVAAGRLTKGACRDCGSAMVQAHHPNGYEGNAALDVIWLCARHHQREHRAVLAATDPEAEG